MFDEESCGNVIFKLKSTPNWINPNSKSYELLVIERCDYDEEDDKLGQYCVLQREKYIDSKLDDFLEITSERETLSEPICNDISEKDFDHIMNIIDRHLDLKTVDSEIHNKVCDGSHNELFFCGHTFNRAVEGDCICHSYELDEFDLMSRSEADQKTINSVNAVAKAVNDILKAIEGLGIKLL